MYSAKHRFFCNSFEVGCLSEEESNHAVRVLRLTEGDEITLIDGQGGLALAKITLANKKKLEFNVCEQNKVTNRTGYIHIAIAPTKNLDRFTFFVEKAIEIGVDRISPVLSKNSERKVLNTEKLIKGAISAIKQSGHLFLPIIDEITHFEQFVKSDQAKNQRFIAHCDSDTEKKLFKSAINPEKNVVILIGPEGDFTPEEIILAKQNHFIPVSLGESRLRTETAGIVACHTVNIIS